MLRRTTITQLAWIFATRILFLRCFQLYVYAFVCVCVSCRVSTVGDYFAM